MTKRLTPSQDRDRFHHALQSLTEFDPTGLAHIVQEIPGDADRSSMWRFFLPAFNSVIDFTQPNENTPDKIALWLHRSRKSKVFPTGHHPNGTMALAVDVFWTPEQNTVRRGMARGPAYEQADRGFLALAGLANVIANDLPRTIPLGTPLYDEIPPVLAAYEIELLPQRLLDLAQLDKRL